MKIIDVPKEYLVKDYELAMGAQVNELSKVAGVKTIYQIGGLSTPGISDIDLVVVFEDNFEYKENPRTVNSNIANYLFTHGLYGANERHFNDCIKFTFFHNFKLLYGKDFCLHNPVSLSDQSLLKQQIALEFLLKMYVNLTIQKSYKTIKLRSLFLHIKALPYDFEFLNLKPQKLLLIINEGISIRNEWFSGKINKVEMIKWFNLFYDEFTNYLVELFNSKSLYTSSSNFKIAPNISINSNESLNFIRNGIVLPNTFNFLDKKYFNILNKLNNFKFNVPISTKAPSIVEDYFTYSNDVANYNKMYIPHFMTLTSSLKSI